MRILLIQPALPGTFLGADFAYRLPPLGLMQVAGCTPPGHDVRIIDEILEPIDFESELDLVGITVWTPTAPRAYEIARRFRERGVPVVFGGVHATMVPEEASQHADAIVFAEADFVWPKVVEDAAAGRLAKEYRGEKNMSLAGLPLPRRDLALGKGYPPIHFVETTRGCSHACEFCSVTAYWGGRFRSRPVSDVVDELENLKPLTDKLISLKNLVFFVDDNIASSHEYAGELFEAIRPLRLNWLGQASIELSENPELLRLAYESGCRGLLVGFESVNPANKKFCRKLQEQRRYEEAIKRFHDAGIGLEGTFIVGFDEDDESVFDAIHSFAIRTRLDSVHISILTPYPGTILHRRMDRSGRIIHRDWSFYNTSQVVHQPGRLTPEALRSGYEKLYKRVFSGWSIARRCTGMSFRRLQFFLPMNLGFRKTIYGFKSEEAGINGSSRGLHVG